MATGATGVSFLSNLPPDNYQMEPALFQQSTERQDIPQPAVEFKGVGSRTRLEVQRVGVVALIKLRFNGKLVTSAGGMSTALAGFPYKMMREVAFKANGQTGLIDVRGTTLRARRQRIFRNPSESLEETPAVGALTANHEYALAYMIDIPVSHDMLSGLGWVLAQNPQTTLSLEIVWAGDSELFTHTESGTATITGSIEWETTAFSVGQAVVGNSSKTILPDLTVFHGLLDNTVPIPGVGVMQAPMIRTSGQLVNYAFNIQNGEAAQIAPTALTEIALKYGGNRQPRVWNPPHFLLDKNQQDYNGLINIKGLNFTYFDFEVDNPQRDLWIPEALVELQSEVQIPNSVTVNSGAFLLYVQESLYPAV
jgi:hypothetical protein